MSDIPALPNDPPEDLEVAEEPENERVTAAPEQAAEQASQPEPSAVDAEVSARPAAPPAGRKPLHPEPAPAPAMPAMPEAGIDDEEDDDIPDEEEFERLFEEQQRGGESGGESALEGLLTGRVVSTRHDGVFVDVGEKSEAFLPFPTTRGADKPAWNVGDEIEVAVAGRNTDGSLQLTTLHGQKPAEWNQLEAAYEAEAIITGKVLEIVKGGLAVDVGVRAFLPASRSGERDQQSLEALVGQDIQCRIVQLDVKDRNVVLDRRSVIEDERSQKRHEVVANLNVGDTVHGVIRNIRDFGAFVDVGGVDALLHVSDISWARVENPATVFSEGDEIEVKILRIEQEGRRIAVGRKQLLPDPWTTVADQYSVGDRIRGQVTRVKDFGAFVEITPGAEGLIHVSEMSWARRVRHPSDVVQVGEEVEAVVLEMNIPKRRVALGLKQALGDPWDRLEKEHPVGSAVAGTVRKITNFGAFVEVLEGIEGLLHISDITSDRRLKSPSEVIKVGDEVQVQVLEIQRPKRRLKLGMKQLEPTSQEQFAAEVNVGDVVSGRVLGVSDNRVEVELGEGVRAFAPAPAAGESQAAAEQAGNEDVSSLGARLKEAWKTGGAGDEQVKAGELRSFKIARVDAEKGLIELESA